jgi:hypothetical protein
MCMVYLFVDPEFLTNLTLNMLKKFRLGKVGMTGDWLEHVTFAVYLLPFFSFCNLDLVLVSKHEMTPT